LSPARCQRLGAPIGQPTAARYGTWGRCACPSLTGKTMALTRRGGVYVLRLRVSGFPRPVAK
jgi:hypothetical protein